MKLTCCCHEMAKQMTATTIEPPTRPAVSQGDVPGIRAMNSMQKNMKTGADPPIECATTPPGACITFRVTVTATSSTVTTVTNAQRRRNSVRSAWILLMCVSQRLSTAAVVGRMAPAGPTMRCPAG